MCCLPSGMKAIAVQRIEGAASLTSSRRVWRRGFDTLRVPLVIIRWSQRLLDRLAGHDVINGLGERRDGN